MAKLQNGRSLLAGLNAGERRSILQMTVETVYAPNEPIAEGRSDTDCVLVEDGLASLHVMMGGHLSGAVGLIGRGGLIGVPSLLGFAAPVHRGIAVTRVTGLVIESARLRSCLMQFRDLRNLIASYVSFRFTQALVGSACNLEHGLGPRLADWIALAAALLGERTVPVTHERLAVILGATRPSITLALQSLEEQKAIRSRRGAIDVLDVERLSALACRCASTSMWPPSPP